MNDLARRLILSRFATLKTNDDNHLDPVLVQQLIRIGNNLNQITKRMHMTDRISPTLDGLCLRIEEIIDEAIAKKGDQ